MSKACEDRKLNCEHKPRMLEIKNEPAWSNNPAFSVESALADTATGVGSKIQSFSLLPVTINHPDIIVNASVTQADTPR